MTTDGKMGKPPVFRKELNIRNLYRLMEKNLLVSWYSAYQNLYSRRFLPRTALISYPVYGVSLLGQIYGLMKLAKGRHAFLKASYDSNGKRSFRIRDTNSQFHSIYFTRYADGYEPDVAGAIDLFLKPGGVFMDIGSNWGHHSFKAVIDKQAQAIIFEPNPTVFEDVVRIAKDLDVSSRIKAYNLALSDAETEISLEQNYFESGVASISPEFSKGPLASHRYLRLVKNLLKLPTMRYKVKVQPLDSFAFPRIDVIKIDAEGVELEILKGASKTLGTCRPVIVFEYHSEDKTSYQGYSTLFSSLNYKLFQIDCKKVGVDGNRYMYTIDEVKALERDTQYNLIAAPVEFDWDALNARQ